MPTELPDSLEDAAEIAAEAAAAFSKSSGPMSRCRVDFDTSVGDETFTTLKASTEYMQKFTSALCYALVPGLMERRQGEMMRVAQARAELRALGADEWEGAEEGEEEKDASAEGKDESEDVIRRRELTDIIAAGGRDPDNSEWDGPKVRIYFPDEGSAALARRDWKIDGPPDQALVPPCVEFSSCGGVQLNDISKDMIVLFFCPRASEAEFVEEILYKHEETAADKLALSVFVNPLLVDMGVTGFGMAGRMLRERLIDPLVPVYYLRTLQWGALTRLWPRQFTVWQEDADEADGYRMIKSMDRLPSNPEVEDIYDIENGLMNDPEANKGFGFLDSLGDFVNGMTRL
mmetsp:Transcript_19458/g.36424  ORF Transcript_19458/g.36424 Transcript_19458/m.36424 type:complete len:346 (-) Transcript_19458:251-1288(-)